MHIIQEINFFLNNYFYLFYIEIFFFLGGFVFKN
jgi:hypothetical protein